MAAERAGPPREIRVYPETEEHGPGSSSKEDAAPSLDSTNRPPRPGCPASLCNPCPGTAVHGQHRQRRPGDQKSQINLDRDSQNTEMLHVSGS